MNRRVATSARLTVAVVAAVSLLAACGSDDDADSSSTSDAVTGASYEIVSDAAVAQGYADMIDEMTALSADPGSADAAALDGVEKMWRSFEGTVKQKDPESYLASEEALDSFLEAGEPKDGATMTTATAKMSETAATYLAAHPG